MRLGTPWFVHFVMPGLLLQLPGQLPQHPFDIVHELVGLHVQPQPPTRDRHQAWWLIGIVRQKARKSVWGIHGVHPCIQLFTVTCVSACTKDK